MAVPKGHGGVWSCAEITSKKSIKKSRNLKKEEDTTKITEKPDSVSGKYDHSWLRTHLVTWHLDDESTENTHTAHLFFLFFFCDLKANLSVTPL